jgi:aconitate hydratase
MSTIKPSLAGPKRPQDRIDLASAKSQFLETDLPAMNASRDVSFTGSQTTRMNGSEVTIEDGAVVIAAITSCTNTSNPSVMLGAGIVAKNAVERGLKVKPWVKTSLAPGSLVVTNYLQQAGLLDDLSQLGFDVVGYGCTTCIGNSGPLPEPVSAAIKDGNLTVTSVLSGNRNFEGRVHSEVKMNYLASPPLVVAYAIAGNMNVDLLNEPLGQDKDGNDVYMKDIWPTQQEIMAAMDAFVTPRGFGIAYADVFKGDSNWNNLTGADGQRFGWNDDSTYIQNPPYFKDISMQVADAEDIVNARALAILGDSVTTDHISPAGAIKPDSPAGKYLQARGVGPKDFNSYGSRRGNHEVIRPFAQPDGAGNRRWYHAAYA